MRHQEMIHTVTSGRIGGKVTGYGVKALVLRDGEP
jgi:hypothetical protein